MSNDNDNMRREIDSLKEFMEVNMRAMKAESESALSKNEAAIERLRTTIEGNARTLLMQMILVVGVGVGILGGFIAILQFFK